MIMMMMCKPNYQMEQSTLTVASRNRIKYLLVSLPHFGSQIQLCMLSVVAHEQVSDIHDCSLYLYCLRAPSTKRNV